MGVCGGQRKYVQVGGGVQWADRIDRDVGEIVSVGSRGRYAGESGGCGVRLVWGQMGAWESSWSGRGMGNEWGLGGVRGCG